MRQHHLGRPPSPDEQIHVLLVEDSITSARALQEELSGARQIRYRITQVGRLDAALQTLRRKPFDIVILDLGLTDCSGIEALERVLEEMGDRSIPIVALTHGWDERTALLAIDRGAQDYLIKGEFEGRTLRRTLQHARERHRILTELQVARERERYLTARAPLSELPLGSVFADRVVQAVANAQRNGSWLAVLTIDLTPFREISETHGASVGDDLRKIISHRMLSTLRATDSAALIGGDRFAVLTTGLTHALDAAKVARNLETALARPIRLGEHVFHLYVNVGIAIYPNDGEDAESLLRNSDSALSSALREGTHQPYFHTPQMSRSSHELLSLESNLADALDAGELMLHFQPIVDGRDGRVVSGEALARWRDPRRGMVPPETFIPLAEDTGLIDRLGLWVLQQTCREICAWRDAGLTPVPIAINISPQQFWNTDFYGMLNEVLDEHQVDASLLEIELTERCLVRDVESTTATLRAIRERGVRVSIDDFGMGYSCLNVLRRIPVDTLKIDQGFIRDATRDVSCAMVTSAIIGLASNLGLEIIAEGVETAEQREFLLERHCPIMQGYFFGPATPADSFGRLLSAGRIELPTEKPTEY